jgi:hypothetical protein
MLDSAFLVWNYKTDTCRNLNAALQCTLSDQLQCHSDRVQVSFPFAFAQMGLRVQKQKQQGLFDTRTQDLQLQVATTNDINNCWCRHSAQGSYDSRIQDLFATSEEECQCTCRQTCIQGIQNCLRRNRKPLGPLGFEATRHHGK